MYAPHAVLALLLLGCGEPATPAEQPPKIGTPALDAPGELVTDVQHLLGEAVAFHAAERYTDAEQTWLRAYALFQKHLAAPLRASDATGTLRIEYAFGQLRVELRHRAGRPKALALRLEDHLEQHREALIATLTPPAPAPAP